VDAGLGSSVEPLVCRPRRLVHLRPTFLTSDARPFTLTTPKTSAVNTSPSCESLTQTIRELHDQAGIEAAVATAARRTFAVRLHRKGYDLWHIREVLGLSTLSATKKLLGDDPIDLGRIVAPVI
jgi:site-specific recombinase XerD